MTNLMGALPQTPGFIALGSSGGAGRKGRAQSPAPLSLPRLGARVVLSRALSSGRQRQDSTQESSADRAQTNNRGRPGKQSTLNKTDFCLDNGVHLKPRTCMNCRGTRNLDHKTSTSGASHAKDRWPRNVTWPLNIHGLPTSMDIQHPWISNIHGLPTSLDIPTSFQRKSHRHSREGGNPVQAHLDSIFPGESFDHALFVLAYLLRKIRCPTDLQCAVWSACHDHDVYKKPFLL